MRSQANDLKDGLDRFAEVLGYHMKLSRTLFSADLQRRDRTLYRNAFHSLVDIVRADGPAGRTREETVQQVIGTDVSHLGSIFEQFETWRARNYSPSLVDAALIERSFLASWVLLRSSSRTLASELAALDGGPRAFEVAVLSRDYPRETMRPPPDHVGPELADDLRSAAGARASWLSYFHLYLFFDGDMNQGRVRDLAAALKPRSAGDGPSLFVDRSGRPLSFRCMPLPLPTEALRPLLASCYVNNPFKHHDFANENVSAADPEFKSAAKEPTHSLVLTMAREAASNAALAVRMDLARTGRPDQVLRTFLRVLRLKILFDRKTLVYPLAKVGEFYGREYPAADWVAGLQKECEFANRTGLKRADRLFYRYYPAVKTALDSMLDSNPGLPG